MSLLNIPALSAKDIELVNKVVTKWCRKHRVSPDSDQGRAVMVAAIDRVLAGERSAAALGERIRSHMAIEHYKQHWD
ncbi:hypothetical protein SAMN05216228_103548 [Rhizobium tibeticum]|uniref:Uncharacterized protein n=1 Tax=Rhizobium tibeticum TaxID=501024 RepID=A0A1H8UNR6_9HYPH|nr:hypothetical protein [Rhizobium tibeticum]SEI17697.1 hypothetical protein RTCCBAU85039_5688 [Rhizobium tibeticum]SEP04860.1 hypothetical protein SAMN05216228_103548 [Rhizobium tibeticum]